MALTPTQAAQLAPSVFKTGLGVWQAAQGFGKGPQRPEMGVPQATLDQVNIAKGLAGQTTDSILEEQKRQADVGALNVAQQAKKVAGSGSQLLNVIASSQATAAGQKQQAVGAFGGRLAGYQNLLFWALDRLSGAQQNMFNYNQAQRYTEQAGAQAALAEGGIQNIFGGLNDASLYATLQDYTKNGQLPPMGQPQQQPMVGSPAQRSPFIKPAEFDWGGSYSPASGAYPRSGIFG